MSEQAIISIFPSANAGGASRLFSEANLTAFNLSTMDRKAFVKSYNRTTGVFEVVLGGYYITFKNTTQNSNLWVSITLDKTTASYPAYTDLALSATEPTDTDFKLQVLLNNEVPAESWYKVDSKSVDYTDAVIDCGSYT